MDFVTISWIEALIVLCERAKAAELPRNSSENQRFVFDPDPRVCRSVFDRLSKLLIFARTAAAMSCCGTHRTQSVFLSTKGLQNPSERDFALLKSIKISLLRGAGL